MGGRGSTSRTGSIIVMSEQEYLDKAGVGSVMSDYMVDKVKLRNGTTLNQRKAMEKEAAQARNDYAARRASAKAEYASKVKAGEVRQPTNIESMMKAASGHQDNAATQAARRALKKRGYDWRTGKKL